ncbi:hypothetical protein [Brasilonema sp. UFV-L1]|uniref:hypothetical protein n=1 Tax=Brasilonema sp. UFV-L1 TaxID=2234130 RepID=UPI00145CF9E7|nr:hypothetical protein [Brasilonema sp. UFV-L1]NMG07706.1 hypothetical protein [Brasilonema sp. UFV-L1]
MATLKLIELFCIDPEDRDTKDEAYIRIITTDQSPRIPTRGSFSISKNQSVNLRSNTVNFTGKAEIRLFDQDSVDADDFLGANTVDSSKLGAGKLKFIKNSVNYELTYEVVR